MKARIGKDLKAEFARSFLPKNVDLGDPVSVKALFDRLDVAPTSSVSELEAFLMEWSELSAALNEEEAIRYIEMTCSTDDPERERAYLDFIEKVDPVIKPRRFRLAQKFLDSKEVKDLPRERYFVLKRDLENEVKIFREVNVPLQTEEEKLSQRYQKIIGAMTVDHDGKEQTLPQMKKYLELTDRDIRKEVWKKITACMLVEKDQLDKIFDEMLALRARIAENADFKNYRDYAFVKRQRFDYGVAECEQFHQAVEEAVVPLYRELQEKRKKRMGVDKLRPWDLRVDPLGRPPLKPFEKADELIAGCKKIFERLDPELGKHFKFMAEHELLDLASRKGKAPGAYSHSLQELRLPFIFANSVGIDYDVNTMLHEVGHSFHTLECRDEPLVFYRHTPLEFAEVASMSMEFLGSEHLDVFYSPDDIKRSRQKHLEDVIMLFCWIATVDAFQHWIYTHPGHSPEDRARAWLSLLKRFGGIEDWSGYEEARDYGWHRQLHIFQVPFYYIEYGIAELGALQIWNNSKKDGPKALRDYRSALALGGSKPLPELFKAAGARFDMKKDTIAPLVRQVKSVLDQG